MELRIPEEGKAVYVGEDKILFAYYGSEIELSFKTEPPHGDRIYSARLPILNKDLPFWLYGRNLVFLDAYYLIAETVETGTWSPVTSMIIDIHSGRYANLGYWYTDIELKHRGVKLKNSFDGESLRLKDIDKLEWIKF